MIPEPVFFMLLTLFVCILIGAPIGFALVLSTLPPVIMDPRLTEILLALRLYKTLDSFVLLAVPFFLLAGNLMNASGVTNRLIDLAQSLVGHLKGGLGHVNVVVSMLFAGVSGSSTADTAGVGSVLIPAMQKSGYRSACAVAVTAASSVMGSIIPPSITLVIWGAVTNTSVAQLFAAGLIPGLLIGFVQFCFVFYRSHHDGMQPGPRSDWFTRGKNLFCAGPALLLPLMILAGVTFGLVTPTEASILAVVYAIILGYKELSFKGLVHEFVSSSKLVSLSLFCLGAAGFFGWLLAYYGIPGMLADATKDASSGIALLFAVVAVCLVLGLFLDSLIIIVIIGPLFLPAMVAAGVDPVHYGIVACVSLSMGLITPPYGLCLLLASALGKIEVHEALLETGQIFLLMLLVLCLVIFLPWLTVAPAQLIL